MLFSLKVTNMIVGKENFRTDNYKYYWCTGFQRKTEVCLSPERSICEHLSKLGEQSQKVNRPVDTTWNQAGLLKRTLSALFENLVQCMWWHITAVSGFSGCWKEMINAEAPV